MPRNSPRFFQGRMFNRLTGQRAPRLYSGARPRRASHMRFNTQTSPYGAGGGSRRQYHAGHAGPAGNVYGAMLAQAQSGRGTNMGMLHHTPGYRGTRMHRGFRQDQASIRRDFQNRIRQERRTLRNAGTDAERNAARGRLSQLRGQHRTERRAHAQGIQTSYGRNHNFNLGGGRGRQWRPNVRLDDKDNITGLSGGRMLSPRMGINVGQNPYTGNRFIQGLNFRRQQGGGVAGLRRARTRNMRIANRMSEQAQINAGGRGLDMRIHGLQGKFGELASGRGVMRTHADFTRGGRRTGLIRGFQGNWNRGPNAGRVMRPYTIDGTTFLPGGRTIYRNDSGQLATDMSGSGFRIPQTNRAMTAYEMSRMGSARGPHPQRTQPNWRQFNPNFHDYRADRFE